jgi:hypothetical protein
MRGRLLQLPQRFYSSFFYSTGLKKDKYNSIESLVSKKYCGIRKKVLDSIIIKVMRISTRKN